MRAVFIRAPWIERSGPGVEVLAELGGAPGRDPRGRRPRLLLPPRADRRLARARAADGDGDERARARRPRRVGADEGPEGRQARAGDRALLARAAGGPDLPDLARARSPSRWSRRSTRRRSRPAPTRCSTSRSRARRRPSSALASDEQLDWVSPTQRWAFEHADARMRILSDTNTRELSGVPPERQTRRQKAMHPYMTQDDGAQRRRRAALERDALPDQRLRVGGVDEPARLRGLHTTAPASATRTTRSRPGKQAAQETNRLAEWIQGREEVHIEGPGTDLKLNVAGRTLQARRRQVQHARRGVLHRPGRGLGRGRDHLPPAGLLLGPRGLRASASASRAARSSTRAPSAARTS